jgi:hypothetical protein
MLLCVRTTIRLDDGLLTQAKETAARTGRTLTRVIEDALRESFARGRADRPPVAVELPTFAGSGLQDGVDLDDSAGLLDVMERNDS